MVKYERILYATDYSEDADIALVHAVDLAERHEAELHVFHTLLSRHRYSPTETAEAGRDSDEWGLADDEVIDQVTDLIKNRYAARIGNGNKSVSWTVLPGVAFVEIVRYAREKGIDLIVMGTTGQSDMEAVKYGSTVENVSRRAHCHVMAIRNPEKLYTL
jgi:nucleotide-binding universal stress UspA family protein